NVGASGRVRSSARSPGTSTTSARRKGGVSACAASEELASVPNRSQNRIGKIRNRIAKAQNGFREGNPSWQSEQETRIGNFLQGSPRMTRSGLLCALAALLLLPTRAARATERGDFFKVSAQPAISFDKGSMTWTLRNQAVARTIRYDAKT